jgi:hypothetical protein
MHLFAAPLQSTFLEELRDMMLAGPLGVVQDPSIENHEPDSFSESL